MKNYTHQLIVAIVFMACDTVRFGKCMSAIWMVCCLHLQGAHVVILLLLFTFKVSIAVCQILAEEKGFGHRFFIPVSQLYRIRQTCWTCLLQVWHLKTGQWEEAESCCVADCLYLLKFAPKWNFLLYLKFLWCTSYPLYFYFNIRYISTAISAVFLL